MFDFIGKLVFFTAIFLAGDFIGEYEEIPITRRIIAGPREGCKIKGGRIIE